MKSSIASAAVVRDNDEPLLPLSLAAVTDGSNLAAAVDGVAGVVDVDSCCCGDGDGGGGGNAPHSTQRPLHHLRS